LAGFSQPPAIQTQLLPESYFNLKRMGRMPYHKLKQELPTNQINNYFPKQKYRGYQCYKVPTQWQIQEGGGREAGGGPPPIDLMHPKTGENFARKCTIFAHPPISNFWIRHCLPKCMNMAYCHSPSRCRHVRTYINLTAEFCSQ